MRLYRMELYKLWHKKGFVICGICMILITGFYFATTVGSESAAVDGVRYSGYEAVKVNRRITEEYRGALTDEKVSAMVERYGLPSEVVYDYPGWRDGNYLNDFVTTYLSDGYKRDWNAYKAPTQVYAIADTELGKVQRVSGTEIQFAYTNGWTTFLDTMQMGMMLASILLLMSISTLFAQEGQAKMLPLLFTTQEGKEKDVYAKIAAAFTLTIIVYSMIVLLCFVMSACVYGMDGGGCAICIVLSQPLRADLKTGYMSAGTFTGITLGLNFLALLLLCAITMCASAHCKSTFGAVTTAGILWALPLLIRMFFGGIGYFFTSCMPLFLIMTGSVYEAVEWRREAMMIPLIAVVFALCVEEGYRVYRRM
ncbi:MAG: ABC transporter permease [Lachnospiraceae bacterium]|nr:ABC transporter permease [Lachnospiraceae bacterium]